ncbi:MAG: alpha/beta hydrolase-fold protein [Bacteroidetes bacterium]|nr:alpha/beta hydrolase-fold protein [Bacteroidota bacterium]
MKTMNLLWIACLIHLSLTAQEDVTIGKYRKFESKILGGEFTYLEHLPEGYEKSDKSYPVVFMMNGQNIAQFANDGATLDNLAGERIPDMILIGISNTGVAGNYWACPNDSGYVKGGSTFSAFLKDELIPGIRKNYRTNGYQILAGQSNAGLFVMYAFLFSPYLFNAYAIASPMFGWCPDFFLNKTRSFFKDNPGIRKKLYISYGDLDYVQVFNHMNNFKEALEQSPAGLEWRVDLIGNTGHVPYSTLNNALLFFFSGCTMTAERKKLGVPEIKAHFEALSEEYGFTVNPKPGVLLDMAFDLGDEQKTDQAIGIMNYLIGLYPDSEVNYYCLGRLLQKSGDIESAKANYNKALSINPGHEPSKAAINKLNKLKDQQ